MQRSPPESSRNRTETEQKNHAWWRALDPAHSTRARTGSHETHSAYVDRICLHGAVRPRSISLASGSTIYATSIISNQVLKVDTVTNSVTPVFTSSGGVDSLVFDNAGIYSESVGGEVRRYDPATGTDDLLATVFNPADLVLEPGGSSILVSEFLGGTIIRIDLATKTATPLGTYGGNPEGLAYDPAGHLFANLGVRNFLADKYVAELDPVTGAVLQRSSGVTSLDGLTYDSFTGQLFASARFGNQVCGFDPRNLSAGTTGCHGVVPNPDGLTSDGIGNLFIAATGDAQIYQYNFVSDTLMPRTFILGLDDVAPASGPGAPPATVPEPYSISFVGLGLAFGAVALLRRRKRGLFRP